MGSVNWLLSPPAPDMLLTSGEQTQLPWVSKLAPCGCPSQPQISKRGQQRCKLRKAHEYVVERIRPDSACNMYKTAVPISICTSEGMGIHQLQA